MGFKGEKLGLYADRRMAEGGTAFFLRRVKSDDGRIMERSFGKITYEPSPGEMVEVAPMMTLSDDEMQAFVDQLWDSGFRPTGFKGAVDKDQLKELMAAKDAHIADLQRMIFYEPKGDDE